MRLRFAGANPDPEIRASEPLPGRVHHLRGRDPAGWRTNLPTFARVTYRELYPGVDLVFRGSPGSLAYDFLLAPGARPEAIRLRVGDDASLALDDAGDLRVRVGGLDLVQRAPLTYQEIDGRRIEVASRFALRAEREFGFEVAAYDPTRPLVIDPVLAWSTPFGGAGEDGVAGSLLGERAGIAVDAAGSVVLAGATQSTDFPTSGAAQPLPGGGLDAFVTKLLPNGQGVVYSTYLGGAADDEAHAVALDAHGNAVVVGATRSAQFPTRAPHQAALAGAGDAFVAKLSPRGALLFSTYLGGDRDDAANAVAVDAAGIGHVAGATRSSDFPASGALQPVSGGGEDAFVARLDANGALLGATHLGGGGDDRAEAIAVGASGISVAGATRSPDFPVHAPLQPALGGGSDAFLARLDPSGASLLSATWLGGSGDDAARALLLLGSGVTVVAGETSSSDFPTARPLQTAHGGAADAFVAALAPGGGSLVFSTFLGGHGDDAAHALAAAGGAVFAAGTTHSADFPMVAPMQAQNAGARDAWLAQLAPGGAALAFSTHLGGERDDAALALAATPSGLLCVGGYTGSRLFPTHLALKDDLGIGSDAFISLVDPAARRFAYSTYLGGNAEEASAVIGQAIAVDATGHAYLAGATLSPALAGAGAWQPEPGGRSDALIAKIEPDGATLAWATYLGGEADDAGLGIAVDGSGRAHVTGFTKSADFPVANALQPSHAGGADAFVARLAPDGASLDFSTHLGGGGSDVARGIAVAADGATVVAGATLSADFPVQDALQPAISGGIDAFVARIAASGAALEWSTYLGGSADENPNNTTWDLALAASGDVWVVGTTESSDFPTARPLQPALAQSRDAFVAKLAADGGTLLFSTYLGGSGGDTARGVALDAFGRAHVVGATRSPDFPVANALQPTHADPLWYDAFVARIGPGPSGPQLDFSTFLGGALLDGALDVAVDAAGNAHVVGMTDSADFPIAGGTSAPGGLEDAFLAVLPRAADRIGHSTRIGGDGSDVALGVAVDAAGSAYLTGITQSADFPAVAPLQAAPGGGTDAFAAKLALGPDALACEIATDRARYAPGEVVRVARLRVANAGALPLPARLRIALAVPGIGEVEALAVAATVPANFAADLGPFALFAVDGTQPPGTWSIGCALDDPATGAPIAQAAAAFEIE